MIRSTERIGVISAAVPEKNISSAMYSSLARDQPFDNLESPAICASVNTVSRVMPGSTLAPSGGVSDLAVAHHEHFSPDPSLT